MQFMMIVKHHHLSSFAAFSLTNKRNERRTKKNYIFMTKNKFMMMTLKKTYQFIMRMKFLFLMCLE